MKRVKWARVARRALITIVALAALGTGAWFTGEPQERAIVWGVGRYLGAVAVVEWEGARPDLRLKRIEIYPDRRALHDNRPLLVAEGVAISYSIFPKDGRRVQSVHADRASIAIDVSDPESPNYGFLIRPRGDGAPSSEPTDPQFVPRTLTVDEAAVSLISADGRASLSPMRVEAEIPVPESPAIRYRTGHAAIAWAASDGERIEIKNVTIDGSVDVSGNQASFSQKLDAPGLAYSVVTGEGNLSGDAPSLQVKIAEFTMAGGRLAGFLDAIDAPAQFDEFDVESAEAHIELTDPVRFRVSAAATVRGPALLSAAQPLYSDAARIEVEAEQADLFTAQSTLTLARNQVVRATISGNDRSGSTVVTSERWTRDQLMDALPEAFRGSVSGLGFDSFTMSAKVDWSPEGFTARADASSQGGGAATPPILWALDARGPRDTMSGIEGTLEARIGDRAIHATANYVGDEEYRAEARIEVVQLAPWVELFAGEETAARVAGTIEGTIRAEAVGKDAPIQFTPALHLRQFAFDDVALDEIAVGGGFKYDVQNEELVIADLHAEAIDGMTMLKLADFSYDPVAERGEGTFTAGANLGILGTAMGMPELFGSGSAEGRVEIDGSSVLLACSVLSDYMGYEEILLPLRSKITGDVALSLNLDTGTGELTECVASVTDGTTIRLVDTSFTLDPLDVAGNFECDSDLEIAVAMGLLDDVEGSLTERSAFNVTADGWQADWHLETTIAKLQLPLNAGSAEDAYFEGTGSYTDGLTGSGTIRAAKLTAAGGVVSGAAGPVTFAGETMQIRPARGELFGGEIVADIDIGVLTDAMPIDLTGSFDRVDLAILTDEVKPPNTSLTGTAVGTITARYTTEGLESFELNASAPRGLSVNRSLVSDLLQSDRFLAGVGERVAGKAMDKLLGTEPQRPFDSGRLNIGLDAGKILGTAELLSVKTEAYNGLNLTVNLDMDQSALAEALRLLEESKLGNVDF